MNNTPNIPNGHIRTDFNYAEYSSPILKSLTSVAKKVFESAEQAARIAVVVVMVTLVVCSLKNIVESQRVTAQYGDAIAKVVFP